MKLNQAQINQLIQIMGPQAQQFINQWNNMTEQQQKQMLAPYQNMNTQQIMGMLKSNGMNMAGLGNSAPPTNHGGGWNY